MRLFVHAPCLAVLTCIQKDIAHEQAPKLQDDTSLKYPENIIPWAGAIMHGIELLGFSLGTDNCVLNSMKKRNRRSKSF